MELVIKNPPANAGDIRDMGSIPGSGRSPGGGHGSPLQYSRGFPGGSDSKESACNAGDPGLTFSSGRSPEKGLATHSSILIWETPWTREPCRLQFMGSQRFRHN